MAVLVLLGVVLVAVGSGSTLGYVVGGVLVGVAVVILVRGRE